MQTLEAVAQAMEAAQNTTPRSYLGMSQIGHACDRNLWYSLRWVKQNRMTATGLRNVQDGFAGEDVMAARLRMVEGIELHTSDPSKNDGSQIEVKACNGHVSGHLDGAIHGIKETSDWCVWEHKQVGEKKFKQLQKLIEKDPVTALAEWDSIYFAQAHLYMGHTKMHSHFLTVASAGGRDIISVITSFDVAVFERLMEKAQRIVDASELPPRIGANAEDFACKWCNHISVCHGTETPQVNCRTCAHSTPVKDAQWSCAKGSASIPIQIQRTACSSHLYIPPLLSNIADAVDGGNDYVVYASKGDGRQFINGPAPGFSSQEIFAAEHPVMLTDAGVQQLKTDIPEARLVSTVFDDMPSDDIDSIKTKPLTASARKTKSDIRKAVAQIKDSEVPF